jgi:hypothetical protein
MLLNASACPRKATTACEPNCIFGENLCQGVRELVAKRRKVGIGHDLPPTSDASTLQCAGSHGHAAASHCHKERTRTSTEYGDENKSAGHRSFFHEMDLHIGIAEVRMPNQRGRDAPYSQNLATTAGLRLRFCICRVPYLTMGRPGMRGFTAAR